MTKLLGISGLIVVVGLAFYAGTRYQKEKEPAPQPSVTSEPNTPPPSEATITDIIDPITVRINTGHLIRYIGVRTPLLTAPVQCFGKEAMQANESVKGKKIRMEEEPLLQRSTDGAWARYVFFKDEIPTVSSPPPAPPSQGGEPAKEIFINERILEGGFGFPLVAEKMKYGQRLLSAGQYASATGKGLWSRCKVEKDEKTKQIMSPALTACTIKGKHIDDQHKLYRLDTCKSYAPTIVKESESDTWFCSEDDAKKAGFEKAADCP